MNQPLTLRSDAETVSTAFPALLAEAEHLASTILLGEHGRRRAGMGDTFWQYRPAQPYDTARSIDWRRSARSNTAFVQDKEWQIAQTVLLWVDQAASMRFSSDPNLPTKSRSARLLGLAISILLIRGGERVGLTGLQLPPKRGDTQLNQLAEILSVDDETDYGAVDAQGMLPHSRAIFVSDFLSDLDTVETALLKAADRGAKGVLLQVLDPQEETFPFSGRTVFESMAGTLSHETLKADDLRTRYLERLAERKDRLSQLARETGWQFHTHHTNDATSSALLWMYQAIGRQS